MTESGFLGHQFPFHLTIKMFKDYIDNLSLSSLLLVSKQERGAVLRALPFLNRDPQPAKTEAPAQPPAINTAVFGFLGKPITRIDEYHRQGEWLVWVLTSADQTLCCTSTPKELPWQQQTGSLLGRMVVKQLAPKTDVWQDKGETKAQCISGRHAIVPTTQLLKSPVIGAAQARVTNVGTGLREGECKDYDIQRAQGLLLSCEGGKQYVLQSFWADTADTEDPNCPMYTSVRCSRCQKCDQESEAGTADYMVPELNLPLSQVRRQADSKNTALFGSFSHGNTVLQIGYDGYGTARKSDAVPWVEAD